MHAMLDIHRFITSSSSRQQIKILHKTHAHAFRVKKALFFYENKKCKIGTVKPNMHQNIPKD